MRIHTLPIRISIIDPSGLLLSTHEVWPDSNIIDAATSVPFFAQITIDADKEAEIRVDVISHSSARVIVTLKRGEFPCLLDRQQFYEDE